MLVSFLGFGVNWQIHSRLAPPVWIVGMVAAVFLSAIVALLLFEVLFPFIVDLRKPPTFLGGWHHSSWWSKFVALVGVLLGALVGAAGRRGRVANA